MVRALAITFEFTRFNLKIKVLFQELLVRRVIPGSSSLLNYSAHARVGRKSKILNFGFSKCLIAQSLRFIIRKNFSLSQIFLKWRLEGSQL